ncbi:MAG: Elongation factor P [candidate division WS2 bacterium ADurb.Bin280]|uniref:Elongation factor P n=1 Tax=candidate division WS2 bacterium ADurb.Bin280 TaxID=1852829 RepID=A0A1V5SCQ7_9BACT|nr:MAG: Elongation factor P [candidate division WS2 bacterium ADurb.Bin280]
MLSISDLQIGTFAVYNGAPHQVIYREHSKLGRGGAILRSKIKNLLTGAIIDITFKGNEKLEEAQISRSKAQFTYKDDSLYNFMDSSNFEQFSLSSDQIGQQGEFLKEGLEVDVLSWNSKPINISLPFKVDLEVVEAPPSIKGNSAGAVTKIVVLETGAKINAPIFIKAGDIVKINTQTGEYVERVK